MEESLGARFVVDCELTFDFAGIPDQISATVNYAEIYEIVRQEAEGARRHLIERLANDIAARLLREHPRLESVMVRVHKPHAPIPGIFSDVYAETTQERDGKTR
jgi:dihydroneopterin aldolase